MRPGCKKKVNRFLDKGDKASTSNLRKHAEKCWGPAAMEMVKDRPLADCRPAVREFARSGKITTIFKRQGQGRVTYSISPHTYTELR